MTKRRRTLPPVSPKTPAELRPLISAIAEILETGEGVRGDPLDRKLTLRDLLDSGIGKLKPGARPGASGGIESGVQPPAPNMRTPPPPSGFAAQGSFFGMINLSWQIPGELYSNHAYTNIYRSEEDNFANADIVGRDVGAFYSDFVRDDALDPQSPLQLKGYYYWITFTSVADVEGPPNAGAGLWAQPVPDLNYVMDLLSDQINEGHLAQSLRDDIARIGQIDVLEGPETLEGSIASRIAEEREARVAALQDERSQTVAQVTQEKSARNDQFGQIVTMIDNLEAGLDDDYSAGLTIERQARIDGDEALASEVQTLTAVTSDNAADIASEALVRVSADEALASDIQAQYAQFGDLQGEVVEEARIRATEDDLLAGIQRVISAAGETQSASLYTLSQIRISEQEVLIQDISGLRGRLGDAEGAIESESTVRLQQDEALSQQVNTVQSSLSDEAGRLDGRVDDEAQARSLAVSSVQSDVNAEVSRLDGRITSAAQDITTVQSTLGGDIADVRSDLGDDIDAEEAARKTAVSTVQSNMNTQVTRLDGRIDSTASLVNTVQSSLGDDIASVQQSLTTNVQRVDGELVAMGAQYTAKVQANGLIGGFGVYNDGKEVEAGFDVDHFWIGRTNSNKRKPFIIRGGVTYIDTAMIRDASIQEGKIGPITVGKLKKNDGTPITTAAGLLRADAIDADNLSVAEAATFYGTAKSSNFSAGVRGWRLLQNGNVEFNQGQFNGTVNVGNVSGLGSLATQNGVSYSSLSGSKPPTNADRTASNTSYDTARVDGTSASTVRDRAYRGAVGSNRVNDWTRPNSTRIDGNKIFTGDAYVDTLEIKGNAIVVPFTAGYWNSSKSHTDIQTWYTVRSITVPGGNVSARNILLAEFATQFRDGKQLSIGSVGVRCFVPRTGTTLFFTKVNSSARGETHSVDGNSHTTFDPMTPRHESLWVPAGGELLQFQVCVWKASWYSGRKDPSNSFIRIRDLRVSSFLAQR